MDVTAAALINAAAAAGPMVALPPGLGMGPGKDSRWLTLEVCREFQRSRCTRSDLECKFAHPPPHVEVQNGRVTCCFDSIKGKCSRKEPPCKYLHPPQHLKEQLLQNGRNNLILRAHATQHLFTGGQVLPPPPHATAMGMMPTLAYDASGRPNYAAAAAAAAAAAGGGGGGMLPMQPYLTAAHPYLSPAGGYFSPYALSAANYGQQTADGGMLSVSAAVSSSSPSSTTASAAAAGVSLVAAHQKALQQAAAAASSDRLENVTASEVLASQQAAAAAARKRPRDPADDFLLTSMGMAGLQPATAAYFKRQAMDSKSAAAAAAAGMPMYPHMTAAVPAAFQHYAALAQPPGAYLPISFPGHAGGMPRF